MEKVYTFKPHVIEHKRLMKGPTLLGILNSHNLKNRIKRSNQNVPETRPAFLPSHAGWVRTGFRSAQWVRVRWCTVTDTGRWAHRQGFWPGTSRVGLQNLILTSSQEMLLLLVWGLHFENHWTKATSFKYPAISSSLCENKQIIHHQRFVNGLSCARHCSRGLGHTAEQKLEISPLVTFTLGAQAINNKTSK